MRTGKAKGLLWALLAVVVGVCFAAGLPHFAKHIPWRVERWMARAVGTGSLARPCRGTTEPGSLIAFNKLIERIYPLYPDDRELPITVDVIAGDTVNAFAALDGRIYVFDGLIRKAESPEELAGVIAHEIAHVRSRHIMQGLAVNLFTLTALSSALPGDSAGNSRITYALLSMKFSRQQEAQADEEGLNRLRAAHVDASGFGQFFARAQKDGAELPWLSSHPAGGERAALARSAIGYPTAAILTGAEWQALGTLCR